MGPNLLRMTKHHGAGNDFLVLLDPEGRRPVRPEEVLSLCDRHRGVGADGFIRGTPGAGPGGADVVMELYNADGSRAEMSGNGVRCLVQAVVDAGWTGEGTVEVDTPAGRRPVRYRRGPGPGEGHAEVGMGSVVLGESVVVGDVPGLRAARRASIGNPHLVLLLDGPPEDELVARTGARLEGSVPEGANVEFVWPASGDAGVLAMRVWERGVGETLACGTGTCAAAAAVASWGIGGRHFTVLNPGGALEVEIGDEGALLGGPTICVGAVEVDEAVLAATAASRAFGVTPPAGLSQAGTEVDEATAGR